MEEVQRVEGDVLEPTTLIPENLEAITFSECTWQRMWMNGCKAIFHVEASNMACDQSS